MSENQNFKFVHRNFFVIIGKLISRANFDKITKKNLRVIKPAILKKNEFSSIFYQNGSCKYYI